MPAQEARYGRPGSGDIRVGQPFFTAGPGLRLRWDDAGADHALLNTLLAQLFVLELDHVVQAAARGQDYEVSALQELAARPGWLMQARLAGTPDRYRLTRADTGQTSEGPRIELLLTLELAARIALAVVASQSTPPSWVARLRAAHEAVRHALHGADLFQLV